MRRRARTWWVMRAAAPLALTQTGYQNLEVVAPIAFGCGGWEVPGGQAHRPDVPDWPTSRLQALQELVLTQCAVMYRKHEHAAGCDDRGRCGDQRMEVTLERKRFAPATSERGRVEHNLTERFDE